jgi:phosphoribosylformylglycinamidine (FGAM) synthase-like enzyme
MTEKTMVERVGWAIAREGARIDVDDTPYHLRVARAALEAMREPTEAMVQAGINDSGAFGLASAYRTMIDAALKGTQDG